MFDSYDKIVKNLIFGVRKGDQDSFEQLLQLYHPLILSLVSRFGRNDVTEQDGEDLRQELTLVFYNSVLSFDLNQTDVSFGLYAKICLNNAYITQLRAFKKRKGAEAATLASEEWLAEGMDPQGDPSADWIKKEELKELNHRIEQALSPFENQVWRSYMAGCSTREIAEALSKSEKSVDNAVFRIRQKLKILLKSEPDN